MSKLNTMADLVAAIASGASLEQVEVNFVEIWTFGAFMARKGRADREEVARMREHARRVFFQLPALRVRVIREAAEASVFTLGEADRLVLEGVDLVEEQRRRRRVVVERRLGVTVDQALRGLSDDELWELGAAQFAF